MPDYLSEGLDILKDMAHRYSNNGYYREDILYDAGLDALMKCIPLYKPESGDFRKFACVCMRQRIRSRAKNIQRQEAKKAACMESLSKMQDREIIPAFNRARKILAGCNKQERQLLQMIMDGYTQKEIGKALGILQSTVSMRLYLIRKRLVE